MAWQHTRSWDSIQISPKPWKSLGTSAGTATRGAPLEAAAPAEGIPAANLSAANLLGGIEAQAVAGAGVLGADAEAGGSNLGLGLYDSHCSASFIEQAAEDSTACMDETQE